MLLGGSSIPLLLPPPSPLPLFLLSLAWRRSGVEVNLVARSRWFDAPPALRRQATDGMLEFHWCSNHSHHLASVPAFTLFDGKLVSTLYTAGMFFAYNGHFRRLQLAVKQCVDDCLKVPAPAGGRSERGKEGWGSGSGGAAGED